MLSSDVNAWFVVQVVPRHEQKVVDRLAYKGQENFLPTSTIRRRWSDRTKRVTEPLFPGYVFCRTNRSSIGSVLRTPGVRRIVCFGGHPHPVPDGEIEAIRQVAQCGRELTPAPYVAVGQKVEIVSGPLAGVSGLVSLLKNRARLIVSVDMIMKSVSVDVAISELALFEAEPIAGFRAQDNLM